MKSGKHKKPACIIIPQNNKSNNDNNNNNNDDDNNNNNNDNTNSEVEFGKRPKMSMSYLTGVTHTNFHKITANVQKKVCSYWNGNRIDSNWHSNADTYTAKETVGFRSMLCVCVNLTFTRQNIVYGCMVGQSDGNVSPEIQVIIQHTNMVDSSIYSHFRRFNNTGMV